MFEEEGNVEGVEAPEPGFEAGTLEGSWTSRSEAGRAFDCMRTEELNASARFSAEELHEL